MKLDIFLHAYLEFQKSNMVQILSFDSQSIEILLDEKNSAYFDLKYPLIYKLYTGKRREKIPLLALNQENEKHSALDTAIQNNQIRALNLFIKYIVNYQNSYVYSYLF